MPSLFHRVLVPATLLSGAVFTALALPFVSVPKEPVLVELKGQPVYQGSIEELAVPYLGFTTACSLGIGLTSATLLGWRMSARKSVRTEEQISVLQQHLREKEALIEELRFSDARLQSSSLGYFLEAEEQPLLSSGSGLETSSFTVVYNGSTGPDHPVKAVSPNVDTHSSQPMLHSLSTSATSGNTLNSTSHKQVLEKARMAMPGAQAYTGYLRQTRSEEAHLPQQTAASNQTVSELLHQIKVLMAEVEKHSVLEHSAEKQNIRAA
ncbi:MULTISPECIES: hypothetical protein [unclassified Leptolyngbya]|uniref:hypothetical protein n=1 Tax=unclassified Leptolyngbya TaxID=2650499 RepID=UPI0016854F44|nr:MULTISPECIES: hypothetical protein [unclassified Leptolyngbya]MBD1909232.1 hypothetical protein [Leptolyngbya sp. FACHB-8]MBD2158830.1 hypothetical protein [Leptolyngbya sp. FACHB-16]